MSAKCIKFQYDTVDQAHLKAEVEARAIFPTVSRAIDRTHMKASSEVEFDFVNRKPSHSINVQMICEAEMRLTNIVSRWPGATYDTFILRLQDKTWLPNPLANSQTD